MIFEQRVGQGLVDNGKSQRLYSCRTVPFYIAHMHACAHADGGRVLPFEERPLVDDERALAHGALALSIRERTLALNLASSPEGVRRYHLEQDRALAERIATGQERLRQLFVANVTSEMKLFDQYKALSGHDLIRYKTAILEFNPSARPGSGALAAAVDVPIKDDSRTNQNPRAGDLTSPTKPEVYKLRKRKART
jgi:hypothetical protein